MSMVAYKAPYLLQVMQDDEPLNPREDYDNFGKMVCWHRRYSLGDQHNYDDTSELLKELVLESVDADTLLDFAKSGKAESIHLEQNSSTNEWEIKGYYGENSGWLTDMTFYSSYEDSKQEIFEYLVDEMSDKDLINHARLKNILLPLNLYDHSGISMSVNSFIGRAQHAEWDSGQVGWMVATPADIQKEYGDLSSESYQKATALLEGEVETYDMYLRGQCFCFRLYENGIETESGSGYLGHLREFANEIATENLPVTHRDMIDNFHDVSDTVIHIKDYEDYMEDLEEMEA